MQVERPVRSVLPLFCDYTDVTRNVLSSPQFLRGVKSRYDEPFAEPRHQGFLSLSPSQAHTQTNLHAVKRTNICANTQSQMNKTSETYTQSQERKAHINKQKHAYTYSIYSPSLFAPSSIRTSCTYIYIHATQTHTPTL